MATVTIPDRDVVQEISVGGTPTAGPFAFTFTFFELSAGVSSDILVYKDRVLVSASDYTVAGTAGTDGGYEGGTITMDSAISSVTLTIERSVDRARTENFPNTGGLSIPALNKAFNKTVAWVQELHRLIGNRIGFASSVTDAPAGLTENAAARASKFLYFDASGNITVTAIGDSTSLPIGSAVTTFFQATTTLAAQQAIDLEPGVDIQAYDADTLKADVADTLTAHMSMTLQTDSSSSNAVTCDFAGGDCSVTLSENITDINFTNLPNKGWSMLLIKQASSGGPYSVTGYDTNVDHPAATAPIISTTANAVDLFGLYNDGSNVLMVPIQQDVR